MYSSPSPKQLYTLYGATRANKRKNQIKQCYLMPNTTGNTNSLLNGARPKQNTIIDRGSRSKGMNNQDSDKREGGGGINGPGEYMQHAVSLGLAGKRPANCEILAIDEPEEATEVMRNITNKIQNRDKTPRYTVHGRARWDQLEAPQGHRHSLTRRRSSPSCSCDAMHPSTPKPKECRGQ